MTLFILHKKIKSNYIEKIFDEIDLERAIEEANTFFIETNHRTERTIQSLLNFFIEHPPNELYKYILTPHSERFIQFIGKKLFNEHTHFPLRKTFQNYGLFKAKDIEDINSFESWYEFNFKNSSKNNIEDHLEAFKSLVNNSIYKLNQLTNITENIVADSLNEFVKTFKVITSRADEIKEILRLSSMLKSEIRIVVSRFENDMLNQPNTKDEEEKNILVELNNDYNIALSIRNEVFSFFDLIDSKLEQITERYIYADKQLSNYKENFRTRSKFQLNLRNFLELALKNSKYNKVDGLTFTVDFPPKYLPQENFKFIYAKHFQNFNRKVNILIPSQINQTYQLTQLTKANKKLLKQEKISKLIQEHKNIISIQKSIDLTSCFYEILEETKDSDIALKVIHSLVEFSNKHKDYSIHINQDIPTKNLDKEILLWQMNIQHK